MSVYESHINSFANELDTINEGAIFHTKEGKEIKKKIVDILKEYNKSSSFKEKFKRNMKSSAPPKQDVDKIKREIGNLFKECYWTDLIIKTQTVSTGYTTVVYEYYCIDLSAITSNNTAIYTSLALTGSNIGSSFISVTDKKLDGEGAKLYGDVLKTLNNTPYKFLKIIPGSNGKSVKLKNAESRIHSKEMKSARDLLEKQFSNCEVSKKLLTGISVKLK